LQLADPELPERKTFIGVQGFINDERFIGFAVPRNTDNFIDPAALGVAVVSANLW
jgi:hypothetical protein